MLPGSGGLLVPPAEYLMALASFITVGCLPFRFQINYKGNACLQEVEAL